jgi:hypothetical protein
VKRRRSKIDQLFAGLRDVRKPDQDESGPFGLGDEEVEVEDNQPRRIVSGWGPEKQAASVGHARCPHPGCHEMITFPQGADGRQKAVCAVHGVVKPIREKTRSDNGKHWGDGYMTGPWQPEAWWERSRRRAPAVGSYAMRVVRAKKPRVRPRVEMPLDPLDYGRG